jgi:hypothetical protein
LTFFQLLASGSGEQNSYFYAICTIFQNENYFSKPQNFFPKPLDKPYPLCYNGGTPRGKEIKKMDELTFWLILVCIAYAPFILSLLPINWDFNPKAEDPYRYCPKEEDE